VRLADHNHRVRAEPAKLARQQARQDGSSIRKKVLLKPLVLYIAVHQVVIVEQALKPSLFIFVPINEAIVRDPLYPHRYDRPPGRMRYSRSIT
jgi:hypothetical protein